MFTVASLSAHIHNVDGLFQAQVLDPFLGLTVLMKKEIQILIWKITFSHVTLAHI